MRAQQVPSIARTKDNDLYKHVLKNLFGAVGSEQLDHARVTALLRNRQRRRAIVRLGVDVSAILEQHRRDKNVAAF